MIDSDSGEEAVDVSIGVRPRVVVMGLVVAAAVLLVSVIVARRGTEPSVQADSPTVSAASGIVGYYLRPTWLPDGFELTDSTENAAPGPFASGGTSPGESVYETAAPGATARTVVTLRLYPSTNPRLGYDGRYSTTDRSGSWGDLAPGVGWTQVGVVFDLWLDGFQVEGELLGAGGATNVEALVPSISVDEAGVATIGDDRYHLVGRAEPGSPITQARWVLQYQKPDRDGELVVVSAERSEDLVPLDLVVPGAEEAVLGGRPVRVTESSVTWDPATNVRVSAYGSVGPGELESFVAGLIETDRDGFGAVRATVGAGRPVSETVVLPFADAPLTFERRDFAGSGDVVCLIGPTDQACGGGGDLGAQAVSLLVDGEWYVVQRSGDVPYGPAESVAVTPDEVWRVTRIGAATEVVERGTGQNIDRLYRPSR